MVKHVDILFKAPPQLAVFHLFGMAIARAGKCPAAPLRGNFKGNFSQEILAGSQEIFSNRIFNPHRFL